MDEGFQWVDIVTGLGEEVLATKYLSVACGVILFYEYFLTFSDEVRYAWRGKKSFVFLLFFLNRYIPLAYRVWSLGGNRGYQYTTMLTWNPKEIVSYCSVATFVENSYLVFITLLSQVFLSMRVYAVRGRSKTAFLVLSSLTAVQLTYGVVFTVIFRRGAYTLISLASPNTYTFPLCLQNPNGAALQLGFLALSLAFDVIAFLMIAACSFRDEQVFRSSSLLGRVVKDATIYFLVIVWAHLTLIIYVGRMGDSRVLQLFPEITNTIIPVMICRLVLSLRKATDPRLVRAWNVDHFTGQLGTQSFDGVPMAPMRFRESATVDMSSERWTDSTDGLTAVPSTVGSRRASDSGLTVSLLGEDGTSRRCSIS